MKKIISVLLLLFISLSNGLAYEEIYGPLNEIEKQVLTFGGDNSCKNIKESDIPTIFIPGTLASWYSEQGFKENNIKKWVPDPITHSYDTLFKVFQENGYKLKDVYYKNEFSTYIKGNPKGGFYLFGYDWKKDNKITAKLLSDLIMRVRIKYEIENGCDIETVNIIAHSMGGLVARSMLEDMCASDEEINNYYLNIKKGKIKEIKSSFCFNYTKINKFITIATPHRGSQKGLAIWTRGNISSTESEVTSTILKGQLGVTTEKGLYKLIHGYNDKVPNGIVTIGQLLPDIGKSGIYNESLLYLNKNGKKIPKNSHPQNSFLQELNKKENIEKMFKNISGKFSLYYSDITGNFEKNNIVGYNLNKNYFSISNGGKNKDKTEKSKGKDLYDFFKESYDKSVYNIESTIRNQNGLGGDGTVPSKNLRLVDNDSHNPKEFENDKFESNKIDCYENKNGEYIENNLTKKLGKTNLELCSHTKIPILLSLKILDNITGNNLLKDSDGNFLYDKQRNLLYKYIGYNDYLSNGTSDNLDVDKSFKNNYKNLFKNSLETVDFLNNRDKDTYERKKIDFGLGLNEVLRYEILSPINIIIEDELGRKIGINPETGMIINEIPGAWTSGNTEGSNNPEYFIIPKTGTGEILHKIYSYGTGDGKYSIVMNNLNNEEENLIIEGIAKEGEEEKYIININKTGIKYKKLDNSKESKSFEYYFKYKNILEKLYKLLDEKYSEKQKLKLKNKLEKLLDKGNINNKYSNKTFYLIQHIFYYLSNKNEKK